MAAKIEYVRDFYGGIQGRVETDSNGDKTTRGFYGEVLNRYDAKSDVTRDFYGKVIARGDVSSSLRKK